MRIIFGLVLILGLGIAGMAAYMVQGQFTQLQTENRRLRNAQAPAIPTVEVLVVKDKLRFGQILKRENVAKVAWPKNAVPEGAFTDPKVLFPEDGKLRSVLRALEPYEPLMQVKLTAPGEDAGITTRLTNGMRAFTIKVDASTGVSGFLRPGDRVDVYWSGATRATGNVTKLIDTGMTLVAVDQNADPDRTTQVQIARNVTVEATPQQVAKLTQAQATGRLTLSLVGAEDQGTAEAVDVDQQSLLGIQAAEVIEAQPEPVCTVRTRRGSEVVVTQIPCTN
ncbi:MAG: Flp pilus assembly protein CpaB [Rhodobacteraceae bacterium]|nr:Flp pilus assembly protein CpaB [Paracoccaceae bacterium]